MKKTIYLITTLLLSLFLYTNVDAYCTQEERDEFKKVEKYYTVTYEYDENSQIYSITYTLPNTVKFIYDKILEDNTGTASCQPITAFEIKCTGKNLNDTIEYSIKGNTNTCNDVLKTETIRVNKKIKYNVYSESDLCKGIEDFVLCKENYDKYLTEEEFKSRVETYKETLKNNTNNDNKQEEIKEEEQEKINILNKIIEFFKTNLEKIMLVVIFIILIIITIILQLKKLRKSRRLE